MQLTPQEKSLLSAERACLFTFSGELLWRSPAWTRGQSTEAEERRLRGREWLEFIVERDAAPLLDWLSRTSGQTAIFFCCLPPRRPDPVRCLWVKRIFEPGVWLVIGKVVECPARCICAHKLLPAPPCSLGDADFFPSDPPDRV